MTMKTQYEIETVIENEADNVLTVEWYFPSDTEFKTTELNLNEFLMHSDLLAHEFYYSGTFLRNECVKDYMNYKNVN